MPSLVGSEMCIRDSHYSGFIASRSMRPMKDEYGNTHMVVDETLRRRMETRLIAKILSFEIREPK